MKLGSMLYVRCRHSSVKREPCTAGVQEISFPANEQRRQLGNSTVNRYRGYTERVHRKKQHASSIRTIS